MTAPDDGPPPAGADVGVLLVHGIGDHAEGDTLLAFGEPMIDWLRDWLRRQGGVFAAGDVTMVAARLRAARTEAVSPAYALADIEVGQRLDQRMRERWLFSEAWWGGSVQVPPTAQLIAWMLTRVPMLVHWHFHQGGLREWLASDGGPFGTVRAILSLPQHLWQLVTSILIALLMQATLLVALVLWLVPIGPWRQGLIAAVRAMTLTLGDSYVLLEQETQRAALVSGVKASLQWLAARCERIVVIAHSQGGAIAHEALRDGMPRQVQGFISVGSGLEKLEFLRLVREQGAGVLPATLLSPLIGLALLTLAARVFGWVDPAAEGTDWWLGPTLWLALAGLILWTWLQITLAGYATALASRLARAALRGTGGELPWWDVWATMDLVPMGRASQLAGKPFVQQVQVTNECSLVHDHVRYFESRTGFLAWCWPQVAQRVSCLPLFDADQLRLLDRVQRRHRWRALAFGSGVAAAPAAIVVAIFTLAQGMAGVGEALLGLLERAKLDWLKVALEWLAGNVARLLGVALQLNNDADELAPRSHVIVGSLLALALLTGWWLLCVSAWRTATQVGWRKVCRGAAVHDGLGGFVALMPQLLFWAALAAMPLLALLVAQLTGDAVTLRSIGGAAAVLFALGVFAFGAALSWGLPWTLAEMAAEPDAHWFEAWGPPFSVAMCAAFAYFVALLWEKGGTAPVEHWALGVLLAGALVSHLVAATVGRLPMPGWRWPAAMWLLAPLAGAITWQRTLDVLYALGSATLAAAIVTSAAMVHKRLMARP